MVLGSGVCKSAAVHAADGLLVKYEIKTTQSWVALTSNSRGEALTCCRVLFASACYSPAEIKTRDDVLAMGIDKYNEECRSIVMRCAITGFRYRLPP
jgi:hypothetical protein